MSDATVTRSVALRRIFRDGVGGVLLPLGFEAVGSRSWVRKTSQLHHVISYYSRYGTFRDQWGVVSPEATPIIHGEWGDNAKFGDVAAAVMTGGVNRICRPVAYGGFELEDLVTEVQIDEIASGLRGDMVRVAQWMEPFTTRQELRAYLMLNRDKTDRREFSYPVNLPLKLLVSATLAVLDGAPDACALAREAELAQIPFRGGDTDVRMRRLKQAAVTVCPDFASSPW